MTNSNHILPRRRTSRGLGQESHTVEPTPRSSDTSMPLRKGSTFHSPSNPASPISGAPCLSIDNLPRRSLTSPKDLEALVLESQRRVEEIIKDFDQALSLSPDAVVKLSQQDVLPVPSVFLAHTTSNAIFQDVAETKAQRHTHSKKQSTASAARRQADHHHGSDSGLGSSISSGSVYDEPLEGAERAGSMTSTGIHLHHHDANSSQATNTSSSLTTTSVYSSLKGPHSTTAQRHSLDQYATNQIKKYIVDPLLKEEEFKEYHPLLEDVPRRIASKKITCLRDLEKTLIFLAEFKAKSPSSYLLFCNTAIQSIHTTVGHLNDCDLRRPSDRPYTNNYFVDLVEQVRQYARIMAITRQKKANGQKLDETDQAEFVHPSHNESFVTQLLTSIRDEKLKLRVQEGKPVELVRERSDGSVIPIDAGHRTTEMEVDEDGNIIDADVARSMARKRKCDIGKVEYRTCRECDAVFTRACDLTKHEKTHSRPWKCPDSECRYHADGWPTEKERDRHFNDKHLKDAALFNCLFEPCTYSSKRESNCKQHMEKAHGWQYVRAKSKKGEKLQKLVPSGATKLNSSKVPSGTSLPTPASSVAFPSVSPPSSIFSNSPAALTDQSFSPVSENENYEASISQLDHAMTGTDSSFDDSIFQSNQMLDQDPLFTNWDPNTAFAGPLYSPPDCPELLNTPGTGYSNSPSNASMPTNFDFNFSVDHTSENPWQDMRQYFPQWFPAQTNLSAKDMASIQTASRSDYTYAGQQELYAPSANNYGALTQLHGNQTSSDFTLYGSANHGVNDFSGSMFPELDIGVGEQFNNTEAHEESIYDDLEAEVAEMAARNQEMAMMDQFVNLDGEGQADAHME